MPPIKAVYLNDLLGIRGEPGRFFESGGWLRPNFRKLAKKSAGISASPGEFESNLRDGRTRQKGRTVPARAVAFFFFFFFFFTGTANICTLTRWRQTTAFDGGLQDPAPTRSEKF